MNISDNIIEKKYEDGFFQDMDPRAKILLSVIFFITLPFIKNIFVLGLFALLNIVYLIMTRLYKITFYIVVIMLISFSLTYLFEYIIFSNPTEYETYIRIYLVIIPMMSTGIILGMTTDTLSLLYSLNKLKLPGAVGYTVMIAIRYIATIKYEAGKIMDGLKIRGIILKPSDFILKPFSSLKLFILPIVIRGFLTGERMAAAAELKGFSLNSKATQLKEYEFGNKEYLFISFNLFVLAGLIYYDRFHKFFF